eukprot:s8089_g4.t1
MPWRSTLADLQSQLLDGEAIFAFLDDVYVVSAPERVRTLYDALAAALWHSARIRLHEGKTQIWNSAGEEPSNIADLSGDDGAVVSPTRVPRDHRARFPPRARCFCRQAPGAQTRGPRQASPASP